MATVSGQIPSPTLARTYSHPSYADPWECVQDYRAAMNAQKKRPNAGATKISKDLDLPRGRVRSWLEGAVPDPVRAIETAKEMDWLDMEFSDDQFRGFNVLTSWIFSGGSINDAFVPQWTVRGKPDRTILDRAERCTGITLDFIRAATADKTRELRPVHHASVIGRILTVLGAPQGSKNQAADITLPAYLDAATREIRREFVQVYTHNRADNPPVKATRTIREERSDRYLESLRSLFESVTGEPVTRSGKSLVIRAAAARKINAWSPPLDIIDTPADRAHRYA